MACGRRRHALSRVAAGEAPDAELAAHLATCAGCRERLEAVRRALEGVDRVMQELRQRSPRPGFEARVLRATREGARARPGAWRWAMAAVAGLAVVALVARMLLGPEAREVGPPEPAPVASVEGARGEGAVPTPTPAEPRVLARESSPTAVPRSPVGHTLASGAAPGTKPVPVPADRDVQVQPGQLQALVRYAQLRSRLGALEVAPEPAIPVATPRPIGSDPIRIEPLRIEPLSWDARGVTP